jgi:hypothetical protein
MSRSGAAGVTGVSPEVTALASREYQYGFSTDLETDTVPKGLSEDVIRLIAAKKEEPDWLVDWRLRAYRHWVTLEEPRWQNVHYGPIDYQDIVQHDGVDGMPDLPRVRSQRRDRDRFPECTLPQLGHAKWVNIRRARYQDFGDRLSGGAVTPLVGELDQLDELVRGWPGSIIELLAIIDPPAEAGPS